MAYFTKFKKAFLNTKFNSRFWKCFFLQIIKVLFFLLITSTLAVTAYSALMKVYVAAGGISNIVSSLNSPAELLKTASAYLPFISVVFIAGILIQIIVSFLLRSFIWKSAVRKEWSFGYFIKTIFLSILFMIMLILAVIIIALTLLASVRMFAGVIIAIIIFFFINSLVVSKITLARYPEKGFWFSMYRGFANSIKFWKLLPALVYFIILVAVFALISSLFSSSILNVQQIINNSITLLFDFKPILALLKSISSFIIISSVLWAFFTTYIKIFYAEYNIEEEF